MRFAPVSLVLATIALLAPAAANSAIFSGTISDEHGRALERAHLYLESKMEVRPTKEILATVDRNGHFEVELPHPGYYLLGFLAPGYEVATVPFFVTTAAIDDTLSIEIQLARPEWFWRVGSVHFEEAGTRQPNPIETPVVDGGLLTEERIADGDTLFYTLIGREENRAISGAIIRQLSPIDYDGLRFDRDEHEFIYWKLTRPGERVTLRLDMDRLWPPGDSGRVFEQSIVRYATGSRWALLLDSMERMTSDMNRRFHKVSSEAYKRYRSGRIPSAPPPDNLAILDSLELPVRQAILHILETSSDPRVREAAAAHLMTLLPNHPDSIARYVRLTRPLLPPVALAWVIAPRMIFHYAPLLSNGRTADYLQAVIDRHPVASVRQQVLLDWLNHESGNESLTRARQLRFRLSDEFGDEPYVQFVLSELMVNPFDTRLTYGDPFPPFDLPRLDGNGRVTFKRGDSRHVLVDIWSPDDRQYPKDLDTLSRADSMYSRLGLRIVSIAVGGEKEKVERMVDRVHATWEQALVPRRERQAFLRRFNVNELPKRYLIDPQGKITEVEYNLSRWMLMWALGRIFDSE